MVVVVFPPPQNEAKLQSLVTLLCRKRRQVNLLEILMGRVEVCVCVCVSVCSGVQGRNERGYGRERELC